MFIIITEYSTLLCKLFYIRSGCWVSNHPNHIPGSRRERGFCLRVCSFRSPFQRVHTALLFSASGFMDVPGCKRDWEMRSLFQTILHPNGDAGTKGKASMESLQTMADPTISTRPNLMESSLTPPLAAQEHPFHSSIYTCLSWLL